MKQGFIKVAAATPDIRVADVPFNTKQICSAIEEAQNNQAKIVVFPELCVTGYTCGDLFTQDVLLQAAKQALLEITEFTREKDMLVFVGVPLWWMQSSTMWQQLFAGDVRGRGRCGTRRPNPWCRGRVPCS